jgi:hypothetical protein
VRISPTIQNIFLSSQLGSKSCVRKLSRTAHISPAVRRFPVTAVCVPTPNVAVGWLEVLLLTRQPAWSSLSRPARNLAILCKISRGITQLLSGRCQDNTVVNPRPLLSDAFKFIFFLFALIFLSFGALLSELVNFE